MTAKRGRKPGPARRTTALGAFLINFRKGKDWSQERLQEELIDASVAFKNAVPKPRDAADDKAPKDQYVSKVETGAVQFPSRDGFWEALAKVTGRSEMELKALAQQPEAAESREMASTPRGATKEEVIKAAQEFVAKEGPANLDIWLLGPQSLPVVNDPYIQDVWVKNLSAGATYRVIWFLDQVDTYQFKNVSSVLAHIGAEVSSNSAKGSGAITHYATKLLWSSKVTDFAAVTSKYKEMMDADLQGNTFLKPLLDHAQMRSLKERLQLYWQKFSAIVVYCPKKPECPPCANLRLMEVSGGPGDPVHSPFFWFHPRHADELDEMLGQFRTEYEGHVRSLKGKSVRKPKPATGGNK
jgi:hypothetical protein